MGRDRPSAPLVIFDADQCEGGAGGAMATGSATEVRVLINAAPELEPYRYDLINCRRWTRDPRSREVCSLRSTVIV